MLSAWSSAGSPSGSLVPEENEDTEEEDDRRESPSKLPKIYSGDNLDMMMRQAAAKPSVEEAERPEIADKNAKKGASALTTPAPGTPFRKTEPVVKPYATVQEIVEDPEAFRKAMEEFQSDKFAQSNQATHKARVQRWEHRAFSLDVDPFPLTVSTVDIAQALLKAGQYRPAAQYFASMKRERALKGYPVHPGNQGCYPILCVRHWCRQAMLGDGFEKVGRSPRIQEVEAVEDGPLRTKDVVVLFALFACREMEAAVRMVRHVQLEEGGGEKCGVVSLYLPATKTDTKGEGILRKQAVCVRPTPIRALWLPRDA